MAQKNTVLVCGRTKGLPSQGGMSVLDGDSLGGSDVSEEELAGLGGVG